MRKVWHFLRALGRWRQRWRPDWANSAYYAAANQQLRPPRAPRVVLLGDSLTEAWPAADPVLFAGPDGYIGRGIGGQTSGQVRGRFSQDVLALQPAVVVILAGTNDIAENMGPYRPGATLRNLAAMADAARAHGITPVLASVLPAHAFAWRPFLAPAARIVALNQHLCAYAAQHDVLYVDYHAALADRRHGLPAVYSEDGVHLTPAGYAVLRPLLVRAVATALSRAHPPGDGTVAQVPRAGTSFSTAPGPDPGRRGPATSS